MSQVSDFTKQITINTTGVLVAQFDVAEIDNVTLNCPTDWYLTFDSAGATGTGFLVLANSALEFNQNSFSQESKDRHKIVKVYAKASAGTPTLYTATMGKI